MAHNVDPLRQLNRSGFPFQLRIEHEIRSTEREHHWSVASREHAWGSPDGASSGFIDIVLKHNQFSTFRLVLECKRIKADDARQLRWLFLIPDAEAGPTPLASCFEVEGRGSTSGWSSWKDVRAWDNVRVWPPSLQAEFCVLHSDEGRRQTILESLAGEVLESIEGLAEEEVNVEKSQGSNPHARLFIFPAIVTNAELAVCRFDPAKIQLTDGTLDPSDVEIETVPFIRFRKSLATSFPEGTFYYLEAANKARERTVFVVNSSSVTEFLKDWKVEPLPDRSYIIQRI